MTRDARHIAIVAVLAILVALMGGMAGWCMRGNMRGEKNHPLPVADTVVITRTDTVTLVGPRDTLVRIAWKPYPVAIHDTTWITRHTTDSIFVMLPYEHRHLHRPDTLDVWYSGVDARIDSATVYYHHTTELIRQPYEVPKTPRLTAGVGCGAFYQEKRVNAYLFGEILYNAPKTTFGTFAAIDPTGRWCAGATVSYRLDLLH
jgi:hypothetical protein